MYIIKECTKCKEFKLLEDFTTQKGGAFGRRSNCKDCIKQYRKENKERRNKYCKQYYEVNKERIIERSKEYYEENKERLNKCRNEYNKQRKKTDPIFKLTVNIRSLIYKSIRNQGYSKTSKTHQILGCDYDTFKKHLERQFTKGMNWSNFGEWHLDHIYPVSLAEDEAHLLRLNHYTNFQPLWAEDNLSKSNKVDEHQLMIRL